MDVMLMSITAISAIWVLSCLIIPEQRKSVKQSHSDIRISKMLNLYQSLLACPLSIFETAISPIRLDVEFELEFDLEIEKF